MQPKFAFGCNEISLYAGYQAGIWSRVEFYSGNFLGGTPSRGTEPYADWQGLALESEFLPDSPNHPEWPQPDCFLRPGEEYSSLTEYQFIAQ